MKTVKMFLFALSISLALFSSSLAGKEGMKEPKVEYSADEYMETEQVSMKAKVYHTAGKERREQDMGGMQQIQIIRRDKNLIWMLMLQQKIYMEMPLEEGKGKSADVSGFKIEESSVVGEEVVNGVKATKSKVIMSDSKGNKLGGFIWNTKENITVKMDLLSKVEGSKMRMKTELKNLKIGKHDPQLFEVPSGYKKMSMGMPGFGGR